MAQYFAHATFVPVATANTEDEHIAILPPANVSILVKRIKFSTGGAPGDIPVQIRVRRVSAAGTGGTTVAVTPIRKRDDSPASVCTVLSKSASGARTPGANVDLLMNLTMIHRASFEWTARDWRDFIESGVNQRIIVTITTRAAITTNNFLEVEWEE